MRDVLETFSSMMGHAYEAAADAVALAYDKGKQEEIERLREAIKGPLAWLERWAVHVGNCETNPECTCGLLFAQHELRNALENKP